MAAAREASVPVYVAILTGGEASHPNSRLYPRDRLVATRLAESQRGLAHLGVSDRHMRCFNLPDGAVPSDGPAFYETANVLAQWIGDTQVSAVFCTTALDPHPDHKAANAIARAAVNGLNLALWEYPVWSYTRADLKQTDLKLPASRLPVAKHLAAKRAAIAEHKSQTTHLIPDDPKGFRLDPKFVETFLSGYELYLRPADVT